MYGCNFTVMSNIQDVTMFTGNNKIKFLGHKQRIKEHDEVWQYVDALMPTTAC